MSQPVLIPFAGKEPQPIRQSKPARKRIGIYDRAGHVLRLFRQGNDTMQIAAYLKVRESTVVRMLDQARNAERLSRGLPL